MHCEDLAADHVFNITSNGADKDPIGLLLKDEIRFKSNTLTLELKPGVGGIDLSLETKSSTVPQRRVGKLEHRESVLDNASVYLFDRDDEQGYTYGLSTTDMKLDPLLNTLLNAQTGGYDTASVQGLLIHIIQDLRRRVTLLEAQIEASQVSPRQ